MKRMERFFWAVLFLIVIFPAGVFAAPYSGILSFGDSLTDNGIYGSSNGTTTNTNNNDGYGIQYFTNGPVWVEYMASDYNVPLLDMAYGGATSGLTNPAVAAAGYPIGNSALGLLWQAGVYAQSNTVPGNALVTILAGGNDFTDYVLGQNGGTPNYSAQNVSAVASAAAANVAAAIVTLANAGGKNFLVPNLPDIGTRPLFNGNAALQQLGTSFSQEFNADLLAWLYILHGLYPNDNFYTFDTYNLFDNVIKDPSLYASEGYTFTNVTSSGGGNPPAGYLFWDDIHPTTEGHSLLAYFAERDAQLVPEPATILLLGLGIVVGLAGARKFK